MTATWESVASRARTLRMASACPHFQNSFNDVLCTCELHHVELKLGNSVNVIGLAEFLLLV